MRTANQLNKRKQRQSNLSSAVVNPNPGPIVTCPTVTSDQDCLSQGEQEMFQQIDIKQHKAQNIRNSQNKSEIKQLIQNPPSVLILSPSKPQAKKQITELELNKFVNSRNHDNNHLNSKVPRTYSGLDSGYKVQTEISEQQTTQSITNQKTVFSPRRLKSSTKIVQVQNKKLTESLHVKKSNNLRKTIEFYSLKQQNVQSILQQKKEQDANNNSCLSGRVLKKDHFSPVNLTKRTKDAINKQAKNQVQSQNLKVTLFNSPKHVHTIDALKLSTQPSKEALEVLDLSDSSPKKSAEQKKKENPLLQKVRENDFMTSQARGNETRNKIHYKTEKVQDTSKNFHFDHKMPVQELYDKYVSDLIDRTVTTYEHKSDDVFSKAEEQLKNENGRPQDQSKIEKQDKDHYKVPEMASEEARRLVDLYNEIADYGNQISGNLAVTKNKLKELKTDYSSVLSRRSNAATTDKTDESYQERIKRPDAATLRKIYEYQARIAKNIKNKNIKDLSECVQELVSDVSNSTQAVTLYARLRMDIFQAQMCLCESFKYRNEQKAQYEKQAVVKFQNLFANVQEEEQEIELAQLQESKTQNLSHDWRRRQKQSTREIQLKNPNLTDEQQQLEELKKVSGCSTYSFLKVKSEADRIKQKKFLRLKKIIDLNTGVHPPEDVL